MSDINTILTLMLLASCWPLTTSASDPYARNLNAN